MATVGTKGCVQTQNDSPIRERTPGSTACYPNRISKFGNQGNEMYRLKWEGQFHPTKLNSDKGSTQLRQGRFNSDKSRFNSDKTQFSHDNAIFPPTCRKILNCYELPRVSRYVQLVPKKKKRAHALIARLRKTKTFVPEE